MEGTLKSEYRNAKEHGRKPRSTNQPKHFAPESAITYGDRAEVIASAPDLPPRSGADPYPYDWRPAHRS